MTSPISTIDIMLAENPVGPKNEVLQELKERLSSNNNVLIISTLKKFDFNKNI